MTENEAEFERIMQEARELLSAFHFSGDRLTREDKLSLIHKVEPIASLFEGQSTLLMACNRNAEPGDYFGTGRNLVFRGYYCPSPVLDITIGKTSRGRLKSEAPESTYYDRKPFYQYFYDGKKRLVCVYRRINERITEKEYLLYLSNYRLGISYNQRDQLIAVTVELWDGGQIIALLRCFFNFYYGYPTEFILERYLYRDKAVYEMLYDDLINPNFEEFSAHRSWRFRYRVENGYYTGVATSNAAEGTEQEEAAYWPIKKRRKAGINIDDSMEDARNEDKKIV